LFFYYRLCYFWVDFIISLGSFGEGEVIVLGVGGIVRMLLGGYDYGSLERGY